MLNSRYEPIKELSSRAFDEVAVVDDDDDGEQVFGRHREEGALFARLKSRVCQCERDERRQTRSAHPSERPSMPQIVSAQLSARQRTNEIQP